MSTGPERTYSQLLRDVAQGDAEAHRVELGKGMRTANRVALERAVNYVAEPTGAGRQELFDYFQQQSHQHQGDELLTSSHCAWYYNAWGALLYFAWRREDKPVISGAIELLASNLALENLMATPDRKGSNGRVAVAGIVVAPGARCFLSDGKTRDTTMADQRKIRNLTRGFLIGAPIRRFPKAVDTALDWTGLWFLRKVPADVLQQVRRVAGHTELPGLRIELRVIRGPRGHLAWLVPPVDMLRPAYWAAYLDGMECYGCSPGWPKGFRSADFPPDLPPMPAFLEGEETILPARAK